MTRDRETATLPPTDRRQLLGRWLQASAGTSNLSVEQHRLWMLHQLDSGIATHVFAASRVTGGLAVPRLNRSVGELIRRYEVLRTAVFEAAGRPLKIAAAHAPSLPVIDLSGLLPDNCELEVRCLAREEFHRPFDLARGPLLRTVLVRCAARKHALFVTLHQMVADEDSLGRLLRELDAEYDALGAPPLLEGDRTQTFAEFALWQRRWLQGEEAAQELGYWRSQLAALPVLELPADHPRPPVRTHRGRARRRALTSADLPARLRALARTERAGAFEVLLAAFRVLLARYAGQEDFAIGAPAQRQMAWRGCIGPLSSWCALRVRLSLDEPFLELLRRTHEVCRAARAHSTIPFDYLVEKLEPERNLSYTPLFQATLAWQRPGPSWNAHGLCWTPLSVETVTAHFDLALAVSLEPGEAGFELAANADLFEAATLDRMLGQLESLLAGVAADPTRRLADLEVLSTADRQQIAAYNATTAAFPSDRSIHELVEEQAARTPDATAVLFADRSISYGELDERAGRLARLLRERGVGPEVRVGVCAERSPEMIVGLLATLKAGGAYVPLDPAYPAERLRFLLEDSRAVLVLAQRRTLAILPREALPIMLLDGEAELPGRPDGGPTPRALPENLAYVLYTSGSTGVPKGVLGTHRGVVNNLHWRQRRWPLGPSDRVLQQYSFGFDPSVWATFWPLTAGATVVLVDDAQSYDPAALARRMAEDGVTVYGATPTLHAALVEEPELRRQSRLRTIFSGGEPLPSELQSRVSAHLGAPLVNMYGPTEATIDATFWVCSLAAGNGTVPIGHPLANVEVYVFDEHLRAAPAGVPGELFVAGPGLARGYIGRPDLTAECFVPHPLADRPGERLYRTGDLGRLRPDGALEFRGRRDGQVKVRGYRIELGEIEATLRRHPAVSDAAVVARDEAEGGRRLVAYFAACGGTPRRDDLVSFLERHLPHYMVPREIEVLAELPRTPNGKLDRGALPVPARSSEARPLGVPRTALEREIARAFESVLAIEPFGIDRNFFDGGGNSVLAARLASRLSGTYDIDLPMHEIFRDATVAGIAATIERYRRDGAEAIVAEWTTDRLAAEAELDPAIDPAGLPTAEILAPRRVLLTGTPGYIGCFLLESLLHETEADVYCLVRATDTGSAMRRIEAACRFYGIWDEAFRPRIHPIPGDLGKPRLGTSEGVFNELAATVDSVYHSGALVNFVYPYSVLKPPNVLGTQEVLRLACTSRLKAIHYLSTIDVLLGTKIPRPFLEDDTAFERPARIPDGYPRSKWVAEALVAAARARGVPACVYRPGLVMGHTQTGATQTNCYLFVGLKGYLTLGVLPEDGNLFDVIPVDYAARAIVHLSRQASSLGKVFHLWNPHPVPTESTYGWLRSFGYRLKTVPRRTARERVLEIDASNPLYPFVPHFRREREESEEISPFDPRVMEAVDFRVECRNTLAGLRGSGIECPSIDEPLVRRCLSFLVEVGFLPPPAALHCEDQPAAG